MKRPEVGDTVRMPSDGYDVNLTATGVVQTLMDTQFTALVDVRREDGGTVSLVRFAFYKDLGTGWDTV